MRVFFMLIRFESIATIRIWGQDTGSLVLFVGRAREDDGDGLAPLHSDDDRADP